MAGLKQLKTKIRSVQKTRTVTRAMEAVSAVKMRKSQTTALHGRAYARAALATLSRVSGSRALAGHPLCAERPIARVLYLVITSDKGLAGALNSGVLRAVSRDIAAQNLAPKQVGIIAVGRKAQDYFTARDYMLESYHPNSDAITSATIDELVAESADRFINGIYDRVVVAYQGFISTFEQQPTLRVVFPLTVGELARVVESITPKRGLYAQVQDEPVPGVYTVEPSQEEVLSVVLPKLAGVFVYHALLESQASEHSARMVAMKSASDKAAELTHGLTLTFNKVRQAAITREVSEITGGMEAMAVV